MASQCGLQNFSFAGGTQLHAGLPHFFTLLMQSSLYGPAASNFPRRRLDAIKDKRETLGFGPY